MNKNGLYIILGVVFLLFASLLLIDVKEAPAPTTSDATPYAHLVNDQSPVFLREHDIFQVKINQKETSKVVFTEILGIGVNSPNLDKYRFSMSIEDIIPENANLIKPTEPAIKMKTLYKEEYEIPWKLEKDSNKIIFSLNDVPAIDASAIGKCCEGAAGAPCSNACGQACSIEFEYQTTSDVKPGDYSQVKFEITPEVLRLGEKTKVTVKLRIKNKKLAHYKIAYYVPLKVYDSTLKVLDCPGGFTLENKNKYTLIEGAFEKIDDKVVILNIEIVAMKKGTLKIPVLFMLSGEMDSLVSKPAKAITDRKVVRTLDLSKFIWVADGVLEVKSKE